MTNKEHAIENAIYSFYHYSDYDEPLDIWETRDKINTKDLTTKEIKMIKECAYYIRYTLCDSYEDYCKLIGRDDIEWCEEHLVNKIQVVEKETTGYIVGDIDLGKELSLEHPKHEIGDSVHENK